MASGSSRMDTTETGETSQMHPNKRIRVNVEASDLRTEKEQRQEQGVTQNKTLKIQVLKFVASTIKDIMQLYEPKSDLSNVTLGVQAHNAFFTAYSVLRQRANGNSALLEAKLAQTEFEVTLDGRSITHTQEEIRKIIITNAEKNSLTFKSFNRNDAENWFSIANPIMSFLSGFGLRMKELRLGHSSMPVSKTIDKQRFVKSIDFGILPAHHILCEGITFPPERRASIPQSLGPLTALICYLITDAKYADKYKNAALRSFMHFPDFDNVLKIMKSNRIEENRPLISLIADIALIATTRQAQRMYPPPNAFAKILTNTPKISTLLQMTDAFNFSGHGAFLFYKEFQDQRWKITLTGATDAQAKQVVYHAMFGTFKEDFGILAAVSDQANWKTRSELGSIWSNTKDLGALVEFNPVRQLKWSKLSQANQSGLLSSSSSQVCSAPVFSGKTSRTFIQEFFEHMFKDQMITSGGHSLPQIMSNYTKLKTDLLRHVEKNDKRLYYGTTSWFDMADLNADFPGTEDKNLIIPTTGKYFLGV